MATKLSHPGIRKVLGGFEVRVSAKDPRTGKVREIRQIRPCTYAEAVKLYYDFQREILSEPTIEPKSLGTYADEWFLRRLPRIRSLLTQERYEQAIRLHIKPPVRCGARTIALGDILLCKLSSDDIEDWMAGKSAEVDEDGKCLYNPATINGWWRILKSILRAAVGTQIESDITVTVKSLPLEAAKDDNALTPEEMQAFLGEAEKLFPQWFPMIVTMAATGARPGELRPIRWDTDLNPATGKLVLRQSQCRHYLGPTKTKKPREFILPKAIIDILIDHRIRCVQNQPKRALDHTRPGVNTGLVFASPVTGGFVSPSCLDKPFRQILAAAKINSRLTPKGMRRSFNDLARMSAVDPLVIKSMTGHSSEAMRDLYSTVRDPEKSQLIAKVIDLAGIRKSANEK